MPVRHVGVGGRAGDAVDGYRLPVVEGACARVWETRIWSLTFCAVVDGEPVRGWFTGAGVTSKHGEGEVCATDTTRSPGSIRTVR
jgi:hypothetical protein